MRIFEICQKLLRGFSVTQLLEEGYSRQDITESERILAYTLAVYQSRNRRILGI